MNRLLCFLPLLLLASCEQPCLAQIELSSSTVSVVSGLDNPRIVGGVVMFDGPSQPKMEAAALVELKTEKAYKFLDLEAESTDFELGNLTKLDDTHWLLRGSGKYRLSALAFDPDLARARLFVELGPPTPPVPPGPQPPQPPGPPGPEGEAPIPEPGFRVLIVYETGDLANVPKWLGDGDLRQYLDSHCVKGPTGTPEHRIIDPQEVVSPLLPIWQKALARGQKSLPWLLVSNGKTGFEGPLPKTKAETMAILEKYAEAK